MNFSNFLIGIVLIVFSSLLIAYVWINGPISPSGDSFFSIAPPTPPGSEPVEKSTTTKKEEKSEKENKKKKQTPTYGGSQDNKTGDYQTPYDSKPTEKEQGDEGESGSKKNYTPPRSRKGSVKISSARHSSSKSYPSIVLRTDLRKDETVNITGWKIKTNNGEATIPKAVNFYEISEINESKEMILGDSQRIEIYFYERPIPDNFRVNKCTGYLNEIYNTEVRFREECYVPERNSYKHLSGKCQDLISNIGKCETPNLQEAEFLKGGGDRSENCKEFIRSNFRTELCYDKLADSKNFLKDEWKVWIDRKSILGVRHDWVRLINENGKIIDETSY